MTHVSTYTRHEGGYTCIRYHETDVVKFNRELIILNSGGWKTATTKKRMNQASSEYNLEYRVYRDKSIWYVEYRGDIFDFTDEMTLKRL